jgi:hypothetical protein
MICSDGSEALGVAFARPMMAVAIVLVRSSLKVHS